MKNKGARLVRKFVVTFFITVLICVVLGGIALYGFTYFKNDGSISAENLKKTGEMIGSNIKKGNIISDIFSSLPKRTNFVILGVDGDDGSNRTDLMMVGCFNSETSQIDLISIPRDTYCVMPADRRQILADNNLWAPQSGEMQLNQVHHYAGEDLGVEFVVKQIEEMMGIKIEYYVKVKLDGFYYLVDKVGGVEFDVPQRMIYNDPEQDLHIDLYPGVQTLDGKQAEGLIRYRKPDYGRENESPGYNEADLKRVRVQQDFMRAFITQVTAKESLMGNAKAMMETCIKYVDTNFSVGDGVKYVKYLKDFKSENINTYTIPCHPNEQINGKYYVAISNAEEAELEELVDKIFYDDSTQKEESSKGKSIQVLNGSHTKGLASANKEFLEGKGFSVAAIGDYSGEVKSNTRIVVKKKGQGKDLLGLYPNGELVVDREMFPDYDIVIILGTD